MWKINSAQSRKNLHRNLEEWHYVIDVNKETKIIAFFFVPFNPHFFSCTVVDLEPASTSEY